MYVQVLFTRRHARLTIISGMCVESFGNILYFFMNNSRVAINYETVVLSFLCSLETSKFDLLEINVDGVQFSYVLYR